VTTADVTGRKGALQALGRCAADLRSVRNILADGGYVGQPFAQVVERTFAWIETCRRLWKNCERKLNASLLFIFLAFLSILLRRS
jgi:transposase